MPHAMYNSLSTYMQYLDAASLARNTAGSLSDKLVASVAPAMTSD